MPDALKVGQVRPLMRRVDAAPDPLGLFAQLSEADRWQLLLESASADASSADSSVLVVGAAVEAVCRGRQVTLTALNRNGRHALLHLKEGLSEWLKAAGPERLVADFGPIPGLSEAAVDETARLNAPSPLDVPRLLARGFELLHDPGPLGHLAVGVMAWDLLDAFERLPEAKADPLDYPNYRFLLADRLVVLDHGRRQCRIICPAFGGPSPADSEAAQAEASAALGALVDALSKPCPAPQGGPQEAALSSDLSDEDYAAQVAALKEYIFAGDVFQIVPSRSFRVPCENPLGAYAALRKLNPSPYMFYVKGPDEALFGASPETSVRVILGPEGPQIEIRPIAGTRRRGYRGGVFDWDLDNRLEAEMRFDDKERAEHIMLVDLARNDVARVAQPGRRRVERFMTVERYSHVMHLVSSVLGELKPGLDALHAVQASLTMGTLTGAPKIRAAELLRTYENTKRGPYGGAVGYLSYDGSLDTAIVIRSALVRDGQAQVRAGAGVVADSDPMAEADETRKKAQAVLTAIRQGGGQLPSDS